MKLTTIEENAICVLRKRGTICPGEESGAADDIRSVLDQLVRKKRAAVKTGDDGPIYALTARGRWEADAILAERA